MNVRRRHVPERPNRGDSAQVGQKQQEGEHARKEQDGLELPVEGESMLRPEHEQTPELRPEDRREVSYGYVGDHRSRVGPITSDSMSNGSAR